MPPAEAPETVVIGGGPAGLTAAFELTKLGRSAVVLEQDELVGGISRTVEHDGYRFDIGGHRFFTKIAYVQQLWEEILGDEFLTRPRLSRIFYKGHFFDYPLKPVGALRGLGVVEAGRVACSFLLTQVFPYREERNFEQWVSNRFGKRLFEIFFKSYTEKVWGMPCSEISADWAAQRIKNLDLVSLVKNALLGGGKKNEITTLIEQFEYPRHGPGQMWEACVERLRERSVETRMRTRVDEILLGDDGRVRAVGVDGPDGREELTGAHFLSTMPIRTLLRCMRPAPPEAVVEAAESLRYRDFLTVGLIVDEPDLFPDNWIYVHSPEVKLGRIQNFKNWSPDMVPDPQKSSLGLEYFVQEGDEIWSASDDELIALGTRECEHLGLVPKGKVEGGVVIRMPKAYPVYDDAYQRSLATIREWLDTIPNLQLIGRNGQHRYNNQDHSMVTAVYAARNIAAGAREHDVWEVNVEAEYHEERGADGKEGDGQRPQQSGATGERLVPRRVEDDGVEHVLRAAFARYDAVALGTATAALLGGALAVGTIWLLVLGGPNIGANLSLLAHFLPGYTVTWVGAVVGAIELALLGYAFGFVLAKLLNAVITIEQRRLLRQAEGRVGNLLETEE